MKRRVVGGGMKQLIAVASALGAGLVMAGTARAADVVTTRETAVRSAPFDVAPEIVRAVPGVHFAGADQAQGEWRRVQLPDGRFGYLRGSDVIATETNAPPAASAPAVAAAPVVAAPSVVAPVPAPSSDTGAAPGFGPTLAGVMFSLLPVGTLSGSNSAGEQKIDVSSDAFFAVAVAAFVDTPVSPHLSLGFSPQAVLRVNGGTATKSSATELDFRGRITGRMPLSKATTVYARLSPAFSYLSMPAGAGPDPQGFLVDVSVGTEVALLPNLFFIVDLGYQVGFQTHDYGNGLTFDGTRYLHLGGGLAVGL